jgi:hypothetical protein
VASFFATKITGISIFSSFGKEEYPDRSVRGRWLERMGKFGFIYYLFHLAHFGGNANFVVRK